MAIRHGTGASYTGMIKAHEITDDRKYIDSAQMLLNSFFVEVKMVGSYSKQQQACSMNNMQT
jgi:hypothetical protein